MGNGIIKRYEEKKNERSPFEDRAEEYCDMTLPYLLPGHDVQAEADNQHGYQDTGATLTTNLANKIVFNLFPPNMSFFNARLPLEAKQRIKEEGIAPEKLAAHLANIEDQALEIQEAEAVNAEYITLIKQIMVAGSCLQYLPKKGKMTVTPMSNYVVQFNEEDMLVECIILKKKLFKTLKKKLKSKILAIDGVDKDSLNLDEQGNIEVYTHILWDEEADKYAVKESVLDSYITESMLLKEDLPWIAHYWNRYNGENYGRGLVEDHAGALYVVDFLSEALAQGCVLLSDVKFFVRPGSLVEPEDIANSAPGEWFYGIEGDIQKLQLSDGRELSTILDVLKEYERKLSAVFLYQAGNRRDAERVTAYELRLDALELETALGGIYSQLSQRVQRPYALHLLNAIDTQLAGNVIEPQVVTGIAALGKSSNLDKIFQFSNIMQLPNTWPEPMQKAVKFEEFSIIVAADLNLDISSWIKSGEEIKQEAEDERNAAQADQIAQIQAKGGAGAPQ